MICFFQSGQIPWLYQSARPCIHDVCLSEQTDPWFILSAWPYIACCRVRADIFEWPTVAHVSWVGSVLHRSWTALHRSWTTYRTMMTDGGSRRARLSRLWSVRYMWGNMSWEMFPQTHCSAFAISPLTRKSALDLRRRGSALFCLITATWLTTWKGDPALYVMLQICRLAALLTMTGKPSRTASY